MLMIRITEEESTSGTAHNDTEGLPVFLAHCGVPSTVIHEALTHLPQLKTLLLCKPSAEEAWEIRENCSARPSRTPEAGSPTGKATI